MDNENTPQSHRILYPGLNGIRTYADLLMMRSRPLPVPDAEVISTNGRDTLTDTVSQQSQITGSDIVPQQSQMRGPETAPQESQMRGSETVPQQSQMTGSDTVLQESQKWYGLIPVRYLRYLHGIVKLCNAKPDLFGLLPYTPNICIYGWWCRFRYANQPNFPLAPRSFMWTVYWAGYM